MSKLTQANGGRNIRHIELSTQHIHLDTIEAAPGDALQSIFFGERGLLWAVKHQTAPL